MPEVLSIVMDEEKYPRWWVFIAMPLLTIYLMWSGVNHWREGDEFWGALVILGSVFGLLMIWKGVYAEHKEGEGE